MSQKFPLPVPKYILRGHYDPINCVSFTHDKVLVSGDGSGKILVWDLDTRRIIQSLEAHQNSVSSVHGGFKNKIVSSGRDGLIKIFDLSSDKISTCVQTMRSNCFHFCNTSLSTNDSNLIASSDHENKILLWDERAPLSPISQLFQEKPSFSSTSGMLTQVKIAQTTNTETTDIPILMGCYEDGSVVLYDIRTMRDVTSIQKHKQPIFACDKSPTKNHLLTAGADDFLCKYSIDIDTSQLSSELQVGFPSPGISSIRYRSDGRIFATGHWDGSVRLFDRKKSNTIAVLRQHNESVYAIDFNFYDNNLSKALFASASKDKTIAIWQLFTDSLV